MIDLYLKAKHWQLFILTFGIPVVFHIAFMGVVMANVATNPNPDPEVMFGVMKFSPLLMILYMAVIFGWYWAMAVGLHRHIPNELKLNLTRLKVFLLIPVVYILFFLGAFMTVFGSGQFHPVIFAVIFPLHLFSIFCIFYSLYFVAKTFKTAELQRKVSFSDFAGEFLMIWFYPLGIWILQPKINRMVRGEAVEEMN